MKKVMCFVGTLLCIVGVVSADIVTIKPPMTSPGKIGGLCEVYGYGIVGPTWRGDSYVHTGIYDGDTVMYIGDYYNGFTGDVGVIKFDLASAGINASSSINSAYFKGQGFASSGPVYIKIQKYTGNNTADLSASDLTASVENVAVVLAPNGEFSYDLTNAVAADIAAGKTYSSYLFTAVIDASGTPLSEDLGSFFSLIKSSAEYAPRLEVDVVPEPATMALLMLGGVLLRKKKA